MNPRVQITEPDNQQALLHQWNELRKNQPRIRIRNAANALNVSEAELLATGCGLSVIRLITDWERLQHNLESIGAVMVLTRNDYAVHEKTGTYSHFKINENQGVVLNNAIDLCLIFEHWHYAFAVEEKTPASQRYSLQFFDVAGTAVHKVYLTNSSDITAYTRHINKFRSPNQSQTLDDVLPVLIESDREIGINTAGLRQQWQNLKQSHDFEKMLNQFQITRFEALALASSEFVTRIDPQLLRGFLQTLTETKISIMLFVKNKGAIQIHKGAIHNLKMTGSWLNILDDDFSLHLDETAIACLFVMKKPASVGKLSSLELYDAQGNNIALIFGEYRPGLGEDPAWHDLVMLLPEIVEAA